MRRNKTNYYLDIAETVSARGTCLRRNYGAIIVKNDEIISTGYVGAPRGRANCCDIGRCIRQELNIPRGERYEVCRSVHAEANAIISAPRHEMIGATMYLCGKEVSDGSYIKTVVIRDDKENFRTIDVEKEWIENDESMEGIFTY